MRTAVLGSVLVVAGCGGSPPLATPSPTPVPTTTPAPSLAPTAAPTPTVTTAHIEVDGRTRDYMLATPPDVADRNPLPLLFVLHGFTQTMYDAAAISGFNATAMDPGAVIVYPQGYGHSWNAGACCEPSNVKGVDDVAFISALIDRMEADYPVDQNRVFVLGGSNGAEMAERVACDLSGRVAAIADVIGTLLVDCQPGQPVSVIAIHGKADVQIPIDGGLTDDPSCQDAPCPAFADTMERWRQIDGCPGEPAVTADTNTSETTWTSCDAGTAVTFITAIGKGHEWYTSDPDDRAVTWDFFMNHPRSAGS
jgi:polyhydroxybutyrate depolymerase